MTASAELLGRVVKRLLAYHQWRSPEALEESYLPEKAPVGSDTIRRIQSGTWSRLGTEEGEIKLIGLAGMLKLPPATLIGVYSSDPKAVQRLEFEDTALKQFILDEMARTAPASTGRRRRSAG